MFVEITDVTGNHYSINTKLVEYYFFSDDWKLATVSINGTTFLMVVEEFKLLGI